MTVDACYHGEHTHPQITAKPYLPLVRFLADFEDIYSLLIVSGFS